MNDNAFDAFKDRVYPHVMKKVFALDDNDIGQRCILDLRRRDLNPSCDLGLLGVLPIELLHWILLEVNIRSTFNFRRANQRLMQVVDFLPLFKATARHGRDAIRGIPSVEAGSQFSILDFHGAFITRNCREYGNLGGFIFVFNCSRVCYRCFRLE